MTRKSGLGSGHNPVTAILDKNGLLNRANGSPFRGLGVYPIDLVSYEAGTFDVVNNESELRAAIERIRRVLGKCYDVDATINAALKPAPVRVLNESAARWASQALHVGFLAY